MQISNLPASNSFSSTDVLPIEINGVTYKVTGATIAAALQALGNYLTPDNVANNLTTTAAGSVLDARQGKVLNDKINATQSDIAIIVSGDSASMTVPVGGYAYIKDNTHGLAEGLYTNTSSAVFPTVGGTADGTVFTGVSGGGLNALNASLTYTDFNINLTNTDLITVNTNIDGNKIVAFELVYTDSLWSAVIADKRGITTSLIDDGRIAIFQDGGTKTTNRAIVIRVWHKRI